jgi:hypothetical protein
MVAEVPRQRSRQARQFVLQQGRASGVDPLVVLGLDVNDSAAQGQDQPTPVIVAPRVAGQGQRVLGGGPRDGLEPSRAAASSA